MMFFKKRNNIENQGPSSPDKVLDKKTIERELQKKEHKAQQLFTQGEGWQNFFIHVSEKFQKHLKVFDPIVDDVQLLFRLVQDIFSKRYQDFPFVSVISVVSALIYFLSPFDLLPDFLPFLGLTDDISVLIFIITNIKTDLEKYRKWLESHPVEKPEEKIKKRKSGWWKRRKSDSH